MRTSRVTFPSGRTADEVSPTEVAVLVWAANLGTLTFHPWPVTGTDVDRPDQLRIDLDPQPGTGFGDVVAVVPVLQEVLDAHGLAGHPKTSGGRGLHVYVPVEPRWTFTEARRATIALARDLEQRVPDQVTTAWWKEERGQKVFVDYNQMARDRTIASAYSIRADPRATVSTPVTWDELTDVDPRDLDVTTVPGRLARLGDLHAPLAAGDSARRPCSLEGLLELADRHERDQGLGDLPYPPDHPKMPGEPKRVQPSRDTGRPPATTG
ncbi:DNA polymerase domain-containing protein [Cellulomonas bogoriensis]